MYILKTFINVFSWKFGS